jgi:hypothetical protein
MKKLLSLFALSGGLWAQSPGAVMTTVAITSDTQLPNGAAVGTSCSNYNVTYLNTTNGHQIGCINSAPLNVSNKGVWTVLSGGGGGGSVVWGGVGGTITNQTDLQTALAGKQNTVTPLTCGGQRFPHRECTQFVIESPGCEPDRHDCFRSFAFGGSRPRSRQKRSVRWWFSCRRHLQWRRHPALFC